MISPERQRILPFPFDESREQACDSDVDHGLHPDEFGEALSDWAARAVPTIRTLSLFSGAGGLDIGFHDAGFDIRSMVEIDARYCRTLERNTLPDGYFSDGSVQCCDVREFLLDEIPSGLSEIDLIIGGPPCQTFSAAGRRGGRRSVDQRGRREATCDAMQQSMSNP